MNSIAICAEGLIKRYNGTPAVDNVSFTVNRGEIVGLIGKNGAGKSTLIRLLTGMIKPDGGTATLLPDGRALSDVAAVAENPTMFPSLTALEQLEIQATLTGVGVDKTYLQAILRMVGLNPESKQKTKYYSLGMRQRLALAIALTGKPQLLFLDEPVNGLDPQGIKDVRDIFTHLNDTLGTTLFVSGHVLSELERLCTRFLFINDGRLIADVSADELQRLKQARTRLTVSDVAKAQEVLAALGKTEIELPNTVYFFGEVSPTVLLTSLAQNDVAVTGIVQDGDDLEANFLRLLDRQKQGGDR